MLVLEKPGALELSRFPSLSLLDMELTEKGIRSEWLRLPLAAQQPPSSLAGASLLPAEAAGPAPRPSALGGGSAPGPGVAVRHTHSLGHTGHSPLRHPPTHPLPCNQELFTPANVTLWEELELSQSSEFQQ